MISYRELFAGRIALSLADTVKIVSAYPASASAFAGLAKGLKKAEAQRRQSLQRGIEVPPLMIVSTTQACNLALLMLPKTVCYVWLVLMGYRDH